MLAQRTYRRPSSREVASLGIGMTCVALGGVIRAWALGACLCMPLLSGPLLAQIVLRDDFDAPDFSPAGQLFYKKNAEQAADGIRFQSDVVRAGSGALQLSVGEHCRKDDADCSERAEVWERPKTHVPYNDGAWYAFSVKFGDPIPQDDHRYVIAQWKREIDDDALTDFSPLLAIRLNRGKLFVTVETDLVPVRRDVGAGTQARCGAGETPVWAQPGRSQVRALVAAQANWSPADGKLFDACTAAIRVETHGGMLPAPESGWIDFVIHSKPGPKGDGRIELIANGAWLATVTGQIGHDGPGLGLNQYFKFGPYRAAGVGTWTMYYDSFRRGPACADVSDAGCPPLAGK